MAPDECREVGVRDHYAAAETDVGQVALGDEVSDEVLGDSEAPCDLGDVMEESVGGIGLSGHRLHSRVIRVRAKLSRVLLDCLGVPSSLGRSNFAAEAPVARRVRQAGD